MPRCDATFWWCRNGAHCCLCTLLPLAAAGCRWLRLVFLVVAPCPPSRRCPGQRLVMRRARCCLHVSACWLRRACGRSGHAWTGFRSLRSDRRYLLPCDLLSHGCVHDLTCMVPRLWRGWRRPTAGAAPSALPSTRATCPLSRATGGGPGVANGDLPITPAHVACRPATTRVHAARRRST